VQTPGAVPLNEEAATLLLGNLRFRFRRTIEDAFSPVFF
jgi:hypothetical protein